MKKRRILLRFAALLLLFCLGLLLLSGILIRKDLDKPFDMTTKLAGFFNEPADEFDLLFFGTSHMYTSVAPPLLWEETGLKSYVLASQSQPIWATYYYIREALRSQTPKCVVLELHMFCQQMYYDEGAVHSAIDHFPFGRNKIEMAVKLADHGDWLPLLTPFITYHGRWETLITADLTYCRWEQRDPLKGYVLLEGTRPLSTGPVLSRETEAVPEENEQVLREIIRLCREAGVPLWLIKTPNNADETEERRLNSIAALAEAEGLPYTDFNGCYDGIGLSLATDFFDSQHMNFLGAEKFTRYLAQYLQGTLLGSETEDPQWQADAGEYHAAFDRAAAAIA